MAANRRVVQNRRWLHLMRKWHERELRTNALVKSWIPGLLDIALEFLYQNHTDILILLLPEISWHFTPQHRISDLRIHLRFIKPVSLQCCKRLSTVEYFMFHKHPFGQRLSQAQHFDFDTISDRGQTNETATQLHGGQNVALFWQWSIINDISKVANCIQNVKKKRSKWD